VLEHIENIEEVVKEVARNLKQGGIFLFTVPGRNFHDCLHGPLVPWASREKYIQNLDVRLCHKRYWSLRELNNLLVDCGLSIKEASGYLDKREVRRWEMIARLTAGILYDLFGKKHQPIEIQRKLGMRKETGIMPMPIARLLTAIFSFGLTQKHNTGADRIYGCLMIKARKG